MYDQTLHKERNTTANFEQHVDRNSVDMIRKLVELGVPLDSIDLTGFEVEHIEFSCV